MTIAGPRVYFAMSRDGAFIPSFARVSRRFGTPALAIALQALWSVLLVTTRKLRTIAELHRLHHSAVVGRGGRGAFCCPASRAARRSEALVEDAGARGIRHCLRRHRSEHRLGRPENRVTGLPADCRRSAGLLLVEAEEAARRRRAFRRPGSTAGAPEHARIVTINQTMHSKYAKAPGLFFVCLLLSLTSAVAQNPQFLPFSEAQPVLNAYSGALPAEVEASPRPRPGTSGSVTRTRKSAPAWSAGRRTLSPTFCVWASPTPRKSGSPTAYLERYGQRQVRRLHWPTSGPTISSKP